MEFREKDTEEYQAALVAAFAAVMIVIFVVAVVFVVNDAVTK